MSVFMQLSRILPELTDLQGPLEALSLGHRHCCHLPTEVGGGGEHDLLPAQGLSHTVLLPRGAQSSAASLIMKEQQPPLAHSLWFCK